MTAEFSAHFFAVILMAVSLVCIVEVEVYYRKGAWAHPTCRRRGESKMCRFFTRSPYLMLITVARLIGLGNILELGLFIYDPAAFRNELYLVLFLPQMLGVVILWSVGQFFGKE